MISLVALLAGVIGIVVAARPCRSRVPEFARPSVRGPRPRTQIGATTRLVLAPVVAMVLAVAAGPVVGVVAGAFAASAPAVWSWWSAAKRLDDIAAQVPLVADFAGRRLSVGDTVPGAVRACAERLGGPLGSELGLAMDRFDRGEPLGAALASVARRAPVPTVEVLIATLGMVRRLGGPAPRALADLAGAARDHQQSQRTARAAAAQARISAVVVALLPLAFGLFVGAIDARALALLGTWPLGVGCLVAGLALDLVGFWWMARLARSVS